MTENLAAENERMNDVAKIKMRKYQMVRWLIYERHDQHLSGVYREAVDPLNFQCINATCLAYRQTGSCKT
ncbi:hypothetical protein IGI04_040731 [Brassica rapa subsp. trilocularis]|uniref:Uncharacterized protein n=1 Tax=Brassica rapa subsp. trilocularis TaxID=1813537 RepID=A0ABQ7KRL0_BRACM|nr:hypothetical protein IGI04_040731 [Brassica rapa subsp. trilocularis]